MIFKDDHDALKAKQAAELYVLVGEMGMPHVLVHLMLQMAVRGIHDNDDPLTVADIVESAELLNNDMTGFDSQDLTKEFEKLAPIYMQEHHGIFSDTEILHRTKDIMEQNRSKTVRCQLLMGEFHLTMNQAREYIGRVEEEKKRVRKAMEQARQQDHNEECGLSPDVIKQVAEYHHISTKVVSRLFNAFSQLKQD